MAHTRIMQRIVHHVSKPNSPLEPVRSLLACGHVVTTRQNTVRAYCSQCKQSARLRQAGKRKYASIVRRQLKPETEGIYVRVSGKPRERQIDGYRVLRVTVVQESINGRPAKTIACEELRIACSRAGVELVRRELLEMGARLDGVVIQT